MKGLSSLLSGLVRNRSNRTAIYHSRSMELVASKSYVPSIEVRVSTRERDEIANQTLAAEREIMHAIENLRCELDNPEIHI